jgi:hypothetical protein
MAAKRHKAGKSGGVHRVTTFKYRPGSTVYMKRYPGVMWVVLKAMPGPGTGDPFYTVRAPDDFTNERGYLVHENALA